MEDISHNSLVYILEAGNPYLTELFGGSDSAIRALDQWTRRETSEVWLGRLRPVSAGNEEVGGFIALGGEELKKARKADLMALAKLATGPQRTELIARMTNLAGLFPAPDDDEFYLSKMFLRPEYRGKRLGLVLVECYIQAGIEQRFRSFRLDVSRDNRSAINCYESCGFAISEEHESRDQRLRYFSMTRQMKQD